MFFGFQIENTYFGKIHLFFRHNLNMNQNDKLHELSEKLNRLAETHHASSKELLENLMNQQQQMTQEIQTLRQEIQALKSSQNLDYQEFSTSSISKNSPSPQPEKVTKTSHLRQNFGNKIPKFTPPKIEKPKLKSDLEKFIGENLINKIGILIIIIGVAIGTKYSIDNNLISPLTRVVLGYLTSIALLVLGIRLKQNYERFSAVLVSGAIAIMYFMTFAAYDFYALIPKMLAFLLMLIFTVFTVVSALNYNLVVIAHIGLIGAYATPFLLSDGTGKVEILYVYMTIINIGILILSFRKYWKSLYYMAFVLTWIIFLVWFAHRYSFENDYLTAWIFAMIFFVIFYATSLAYKLLHSEQFAKNDIILILGNAFIFYGIGFRLTDNSTYSQLLGLYTLGNAAIHFAVSLIIKQKNLVDKNLFNMVLGIVLVFITVAVPVQLDGNWVTMIWAGEAAVLFWLGRSRGVLIYEKLAYPLFILAFGSLLHDWKNIYDYSEEVLELTPFLNVRFLAGLLFCGAYGFSIYLNTKYKGAGKTPVLLLHYFVPAVFLLVAYNIFRLEIELFWQQKYIGSKLEINDPNGGYTHTYYNFNYSDFQVIWTLNYSLFFVSVLGLFNLFRLKNRRLADINLVLNIVSMLAFLGAGLFAMSELRTNYIQQIYAEYYTIGIQHLWIRYISYVFVIFYFIVFFQYTAFIQKTSRYIFDFVLYVSVLWILSSELIHWMDLYDYGSKASYKLALSILWGIYSLFLIILGIWKHKKYLRIGAMVWFGITLGKLFLYDISHLETIAKTIVFLSLGSLLLLISFLYNKYKNVISDGQTNTKSEDS